jgi:hypothetical protein
MLDDDISTNSGTRNQKKSHEENLIAEYNGKLLRNFVSNALKSAVHAAGRSPAAINAAANLTPKRNSKTELPTAMQVFSALAIGRNVLIEQFNEEEFRTSMVTDSPGAKGIIQQVEAALRKRIDLLMDVDNLYSKRYELSIFQSHTSLSFNVVVTIYTQSMRREHAQEC